MNLIARMRRALFRAIDPPERLVTGWGSDIVAGPMPQPDHSESSCYPRSDCPGIVVTRLCGSCGSAPAMTRDEAARGRENGGE